MTSPSTSYLLVDEAANTTSSTSNSSNSNNHLEQARDAVGQGWNTVASTVQSTWKDTVEPTVVRPVQQHVGNSARRVGDTSRSMSLATQAAALTTLEATKQSLANIGSSPLEQDSETGETVVKGEQTDGLVGAVHIAPVTVVSAVGLVSGLVSFFMITGRLVDIASLMVMAFAPVVVYQKLQLAALGGLRGQQNRLRRSANELTLQNGTLGRSVDELSSHVKTLHQVETKLTRLAETKGAQVAKLVHIVHENGVLQKKIKDTLQSQVMQQLVFSVVQTDKDQDFNLSANEVANLKLTLSCLPGVGFDEVNFNAFVNADTGGLTLQDVLSIVHRLTDDTVDETDHIFHLNPKDVLNSNQ